MSEPYGSYMTPDEYTQCEQQREDERGTRPPVLSWCAERINFNLRCGIRRISVAGAGNEAASALLDAYRQAGWSVVLDRNELVFARPGWHVRIDGRSLVFSAPGEKEVHVRRHGLSRALFG